jgi:predicted amidophosphoribosyltransferase
MAARLTWPGATWLGETWSGLVDLVLPAACPGCRAPGAARLCGECRESLSRLRAHPVRPTPAPPGLPPCVAMGGYQGVLREVLLAYKERGRYPLARLLGDLLAGSVLGALAATGHRAGTPVLLVPVPDTPSAARERYGDHMRRLAGHAADRLNRSGWPAGVAVPVTARPRPDSAHLGAAGRLAASAGAFAPRTSALRRVIDAQRRGTVTITVDDIVTTGATLAALACLLDSHGIRVPAAAVLAATRRRSVPRLGEFSP